MQSVAGVSALALGGCAAQGSGPGRSYLASKWAKRPPTIAPPAHVAAMYAAVPNEKFDVPAVEINRIAERYWRRRVPYVTGYAPGTVVVDTSTFHLHLVEPGGTAMRYGVSLGKAGFEWSGSGVIQWKTAWPKWTPPSEMIARNPDLEPYSAENGGMAPGPENPLGARALYIFENGRDTLYRVHGTPDSKSIGYAVSYGCVRMINQDVMDLYERVKPGARIFVT